MIRRIKKMFQDRKIKKQKLEKLSDLVKELNKLQKHLDHEGRMRGMCDYEENDMKHFYSIQKQRDDKRMEAENYRKTNNL